MPDGTRTWARPHSHSLKHRAPPKAHHNDVSASPVIDSMGEETAEAIRTQGLAVAPRNVLHRNPLFRNLYLGFYVLTTLLILLPLWTILYIPRANRPRQGWSLKRSLRVRCSRRLCAVVARCEIDYLGRDLSVRLDPKTLKCSHPVTIGPAPKAWLRGHPAQMLEQLNASRGKWRPQFVHRLFRNRRGAFGAWNPSGGPPHTGFVSVEAFWYTGNKRRATSLPPPRKEGEPVLLMFHGGGYICGTAAESDLTSSIPKAVVKHTLIHHVLSVDYRLAPSAPWPLPLLDAISAYHHAVNVEGIAERDLVIGGDSAGAHLALALTRWLRDEGPALNLSGPRGLVLLSPWSDLGFTHQWGEGIDHNRQADTIDDSFGLFASSLLTRALPPSVIHEEVYISPASRLIPYTSRGPASFESFPPTFIVYGGAERISLEIMELFTRFESARAADPTPRAAPDVLHCAPDGVHDFMIFGHFAEESSVAYARIDEWLRVLLSDSAADAASSSPGDTLPPFGAISPILMPAASPALSLTAAAGVTFASPTNRPAIARRNTPRRDYTQARSPRLTPHADTSRLMVHDLRDQGFGLMQHRDSHGDVPPLSLDSVGETVGVFAAQAERGVWDFESRGGEWYELGDEAVSEDRGDADAEEEVSEVSTSEDEGVVSVASSP